jgi:nucleoside-diphosphate-sugar epimerase
MSALGARVAVADALDREALIGVVADAGPTHVIHQLTALPKQGPRRPADLLATNRLRIDGTRNLLDAATAANARRFLVGSYAVLAPRSDTPPIPENPAAAAIRSMESQVLDATRRGRIEGVVLRYGMFYSLETPSTTAMIDMVRRRRLPVVRGDSGQLPLIHVDDAVSATVRALDAAPTGSIYDIVDDRAVSMSELVGALAQHTGSPAPFRVPRWLPKLASPYLARQLGIRLVLANAKAKAELGWRPMYPTYREGLAHMFKEAAR